LFLLLASLISTGVIGSLVVRNTLQTS